MKRKVKKKKSFFGTMPNLTKFTENDGFDKVKETKKRKSYFGVFKGVGEFTEADRFDSRL